MVYYSIFLLGNIHISIDEFLQKNQRLKRETSINKLMFHIMRFTISIDITTFIYSLTKFMNTHNADVKPVNNFH